MDVFPIAPGELLAGYLGRLAVANNCPNSAALSRLINDQRSTSKNAEQHGDIQDLAEVLRMDRRSLLQRHTTYPLSIAFADENDVGIPWPYDSAALNRQKKRSILALCPKCLERDLDELHMSYWRRAHQIAGLFHCPEHGVELLFANTDKRFRLRPDEALARAHRADAELVTTAKNDPVAIRCNEVLQAMLEIPATVSRQRIKSSLQEVASSHPRLLKKRVSESEKKQWMEVNISSRWVADLFGRRLGHICRVNCTVNAIYSNTSFFGAYDVALACGLYGLALSKAKELMSIPLEGGTHCERLESPLINRFF